ncbi:hypothetical protein ACF0H5_005889 [Mactra antiquata]
MGRGKRKNRNSSDDGFVEKLNTSKLSKAEGPSSDLNTSVSDILSQANAVIFNTDDSVSVFDTNSNPGDNTESREMSSNNDIEPSNSDLMKCSQSISTRLGGVEKKLSKLDTLEKKVNEFDTELKNIWLKVDERTKRVEERVTNVEDKVDSVEIETTLLSSKVMAWIMN